MDFVGVGNDIAAFLGKHDAPVALIGALALDAYGITRATLDLDLLTVRSAQDALIEHLEGEGWETLHRSEGYSNHLHSDPERGRVDIVYVDARTAARLFDAATSREVLEGLRLPVPSPEHLIALKVRAMKNDPSRRLQDMADVQQLMRMARVDRAAVREYFRRLDLLDLLERIEETL